MKMLSQNFTRQSGNTFHLCWKTFRPSVLLLIFGPPTCAPCVCWVCTQYHCQHFLFKTATKQIQAVWQCGSVGGISCTTIGIRTTLLKISESVSGRKTNLDLGLKRTTPPHHDVSMWLGTIQRDIPAVLLPAWRNMHLHLQLSNCQLSVTLCNSFLCSLKTYLRYWWINLLHVDLCPQRCQCFYNAYLTAQRKAGMSPWLLPSTYPMCHSVS